MLSTKCWEAWRRARVRQQQQWSHRRVRMWHLKPSLVRRWQCLLPTRDVAFRCRVRSTTAAALAAGYGVLPVLYVCIECDGLETKSCPNRPVGTVLYYTVAGLHTAALVQHWSAGTVQQCFAQEARRRCKQEPVGTPAPGPGVGEARQCDRWPANQPQTCPSFLDARTAAIQVWLRSVGW